MSPTTGTLLDIGCGAVKFAPNWTGIDYRPLPGVDIVHDLEVFPYPIPDDSVLTARMSHTIEHMKPWLTLSVMDEIWRIMKPKGQLYIAAPYGVSYRFVQDPTHCNPVNETTFLYFDPAPAHLKGGVNILYSIYQPKPWKIEMLYYQDSGDIEVVMSKRPFPYVPEEEPKTLEINVAEKVEITERIS